MLTGVITQKIWRQRRIFYQRVEDNAFHLVDLMF